jgi:hypothetical protein
MYRVEHREVADSERIKEPVEFAKANVENLVRWLCTRGLLKRPSKSEQRHPRPAWRVWIGEHEYRVRWPVKPSEEGMVKVTVEAILELDNEVRHFAKFYRKNDCEQAVWHAFEIGRLIETVEVLCYDPEVGAGRKALANYVAMRQASAEKRRTTPEKRRAIIAAHLSKKSWGQIERDEKVSRSTIARTLKRYRQTTR